MTSIRLLSAPEGTRVIWNKPQSAQRGEGGYVALSPNGFKYVQWDDGTALGLESTNKLHRLLPYVKESVKVPTAEAPEGEKA